MHLVVNVPFGPHQRGDLITDEATIKAVLDDERAGFVRAISDGQPEAAKEG